MMQINWYCLEPYFHTQHIFLIKGTHIPDLYNKLQNFSFSFYQSSDRRSSEPLVFTVDGFSPGVLSSKSAVNGGSERIRLHNVSSTQTDLTESRILQNLKELHKCVLHTTNQVEKLRKELAGEKEENFHNDEWVMFATVLDRLLFAIMLCTCLGLLSWIFIYSRKDQLPVLANQWTRFQMRWL